MTRAGRRRLRPASRRDTAGSGSADSPAGGRGPGADPPAACRLPGCQPDGAVTDLTCGFPVDFDSKSDSGLN